MSNPLDAIRQRLAAGPQTARSLGEILRVSQPTVSRLLSGMGDELVRIGAARSIQYALRDSFRGLPEISVYRADDQGRVGLLGTLVPVRPDGFVMRAVDGQTLYSAGLPWWLLDMRPQGYLGRTYVAKHAALLNLPLRLNDWSDSHALRALLAHGHDAVGNLLLGEVARERFLSEPEPQAIALSEKPERYAALASAAAQGELPGSSAGGEQPKFTAFAQTNEGQRHVIVKFTEADAGPVAERWADVLLAEHLALQTLCEAGVSASQTNLLAHCDQRFLEVQRFDRVGTLGRVGLFSLEALDAEFVGSGRGAWPELTRKLSAQRLIRPEDVAAADLLWAFGTLMGNTDMHNGNLSFIASDSPPYTLAPAYDMAPMAFAPRSGGGLPDTLPDATLAPTVPNDTWRQALQLAQAFMGKVQSAAFSPRFQACVAALERHVETASRKIGRLG
jgi:HipA-like C-terminal domain